MALLFKHYFSFKHLAALAIFIAAAFILSAEPASAQLSCPDITPGQSLAADSDADTCVLSSSFPFNGVVFGNDLNGAGAFGPVVGFSPRVNGIFVPVTTSCTGAGCRGTTRVGEACRAAFGDGDCNFVATYTLGRGGSAVTVTAFAANNSSTLSSIQVVGGPFAPFQPSSITPFEPRDNTVPTDADTLIWTVFFDTGVQNVDAADFAIQGPTGTNIAVAVNPGVGAPGGLPQSFNVTVSGGTLPTFNGRVTLEFSAAQNIIDEFGNTLDSTARTGRDDNFYDVLNDAIAPTVTSISRSNPTTELTNADSLTWRVVFDEDVQNVDAADFAISGSTATLAVSSISATTYDVTATGGDLASFNGNVTLSFDAAQNITDVAANALSSTAPTGTNEPTYQVRNQGPVIASITRETPTTELTNADSVTWSVLFSDISNGFSMSPSDFSVSGTTASLSVTRFSIGFTVTASGGDFADLDGIVTLTVNAGPIVDEFGNELVSPTPTGANDNTYSLDNTAPTVSIDMVPSQANSDFTATFIFSENVTGFDLGDISLVNASASNLSGAGANFTATITPDGNGDVSINVPADIAADEAGNGNTESATVAVSVDVTPPTLEISNIPAAIDGPFTATFTFSEPVADFVLSDIVVTNGAASAFQIQGGGTGPATVFTVLITPQSEGDLTITVNASALSDAAGNLNVSATTAATVVDTTAPTVMLSAVPSDVRGPFPLTITFSEDVTGFELADLTLSNALGSSFSVTSASVYTVTISPVAQGRVTMNVAANIATDASGNGNQAGQEVSTEFLDEEFVRSRTMRIIANFMARRADLITVNDPLLAPRLLGGGAHANVSGEAVRGHGDVEFRGQIQGDRLGLDALVGDGLANKIGVWVETTWSTLSSETTDDDLTLVYAGIDMRLHDDLIVGLMGQYDNLSEADSQAGFEISGTGWMAGPYFVTRLTDNLILDGRAAWGQSSNEVRPFGTYEDEFDADRALLKTQLTGDFTLNDWNFYPDVSVIYFEETQDAYVDSYNVSIPEQSISLGRMTFGPRFSRTFENTTGPAITPSVALRGIWDFEPANTVNLVTGQGLGQSDLRARTNASLQLRFENGNTLGLEGFYDGIGDETYDASGVTLKLGVPF